jgi:Tfp pilus assembly protein PilN
MRPLQLDYHDSWRFRDLFGYLLLVVALFFITATGWYFNSLRLETQRLSSQEVRVQNRMHRHETSSEVSQMPPEKFAEVIKYTNHVIRQLNLPWDTIFSQLEAATGKGVALLGVEPNVNRSEIKVIGEAKDYAAMLNYVRKLSEQKVFHGVYLTEHKMDDQNPDKPIRFTLEASWVEK